MGIDSTSHGPAPPVDPFGAFLRENHAALLGASTGELAGLRFAAKDVFDVAGHRTGFGNPTWLATHAPAAKTAKAVQLLLDAGADLVGRTITDELTYSLTGENIHYGTPVNPRCPDRVPGGSSSGSVSAVAGGLVDFSLGSDCAGSVRLPASYCGVLGMRPTHGRVSLSGVTPFSESFDTVGWFASDVAMLERAGRVLLGETESESAPGRLLIATDAFGVIEPAVADALRAPLGMVSRVVGRVEEVTVSEGGLFAWMETFRTIQAAEIWAAHGDWIRQAKPRFGQGIRERLAWASTVSQESVAAARARRKGIVARIERILDDGVILCLPTSPGIAPLKNSGSSDVEITRREQAICLLCIAGLGGLPQITLPLGTLQGCPLGLSVIGRRGSDLQLLALAVRVMDETRNS